MPSLTAAAFFDVAFPFERGAAHSTLGIHGKRKEVKSQQQESSLHDTSWQLAIPYLRVS